MYTPDMYTVYAHRVPLPLLLLCCHIAMVAAAAVRHRVADGKVCCWFIEESDSSVFFLFIQPRFIFIVALGSTVAFSASICL